jgi:hypothetical protein
MLWCDVVCCVVLCCAVLRVRAGLCVLSVWILHGAVDVLVSGCDASDISSCFVYLLIYVFTR